MGRFRDVEEKMFDPDRMNEQITFRDRPLRALLDLQPLEGDVHVGVAGDVKETKLLDAGRLLPRVDPEGEAVLGVARILLKQPVLQVSGKQVDLFSYKVRFVFLTSH